MVKHLLDPEFGKKFMANIQKETVDPELRTMVGDLMKPKVGKLFIQKLNETIEKDAVIGILCIRR